MLNVSKQSLRSDTRYQDIRVQHDGAIYADFDKLNDLITQRTKRSATTVDATLFARFARVMVGDDIFFKSLPEKQRYLIKGTLDKEKILYPGQCAIINNVWQKTVMPVFDKYIETGYMPIEHRRPITSEYIKEHYWGRKKTTKEIAYDLFVPEYWVAKQIKKLKMGKKENSVPPKGRKGWQPPDPDAYAAARARQPHAKQISCIDPFTGRVAKTYRSITYAETDGFSRNNIKRAIQTCGLHRGFLWAEKGMENITYEIALKRNIAKRIKTLAVQRPDAKTLQQLYTEYKLSTREIARKYGCTPNTVHQWASKMGIRRPSRPRMTKKILTEMYIEQNMTATQIAEKTGYTQKTISTYLCRHGIKKKEQPMKDKLEPIHPSSISTWKKVEQYKNKHGKLPGDQVSTTVETVERLSKKSKGEPMTYNAIKLNYKVVIEKHIYDGYNGDSVRTWRIDNTIDSTELTAPGTEIYKFNGTKSVQLCLVTHDGMFHPDEVIAIALLRIAGFQFDVIRSRETENIIDADILVDVGGKCDPENFEFDHHQFEKSHALYGKSSAGLVTDWLFCNVPEDFRKFIAAVDARDTRVAYHPDNGWESMLNSIAACNQIDINSIEQNDAFNTVLKLVENFIFYRWFARKEHKNLSTQAENDLQSLAERTTAAKEEEFRRRRENTQKIHRAIQGEYYPEWIEDVSKEYPLFITGAGNKTKVMVNTDICKIIDISGKEFIHANGFIAVSDDLAPTVIIEFKDGTVKAIVPYLQAS